MQTNISTLKAFFCFVAFIVPTKSVSGQTEDWNNYLFKYRGNPASVLVDNALNKFPQQFRYPFLLIAGPRIDNCGKNGMPGAKELNQMEEILDVTTHFIEGVTPKVLAGTFTYQCERVNYYYVSDTTGIRNALGRLYRRNYPGLPYVLKIKRDPAWQTYAQFLYPSDTLQNEHENNQIITDMLVQGDSLTGIRQLSFASCYQTDSQASAFMAYAQNNHFKIERKHFVKNTPLPNCVLVSCNKPIITDTINAITLPMKAKIELLGGTYLRWSSPIITTINKRNPK